VFAVDIDGAGLEATVAAAAPGRVTAHKSDVSSREQCRAAVAACVEQNGRLDVLGNIAGVVRIHHVADVTEDEWNLLMSVNVAGPFWLAQAAIPHLIESGGNIVNIASNAGFMGQAYTVPYCVTKGGVVQLTRALAMEFMKTPLRVNAIAPGGTMTGMVTNISFPENVDPELMARYSGMRGIAPPEDIAALFAFIASDEGRNLHGAILSSDYGVTAG
jgi:NAD(P)-dependent dehydrogenase (short-subunit alcohol dehydrogenase family)